MKRFVLLVTVPFLVACGPTEWEKELDEYNEKLDAHGETRFCITTDNGPVLEVVGLRTSRRVSWGQDGACVMVVQDGMTVATACGMNVLAAPCPEKKW